MKESSHFLCWTKKIVPKEYYKCIGTDVARKMIILGRECGLAVEMQSVKVQSLVPPQLAEAQSADDFMAQLPQVGMCVIVHHYCVFA